MSQPTPLSAATFRAKVLALQAQRLVRDMAQPLPEIQKRDEALPYLLSELRTQLWREEDPREAGNEQGKVQNLRLVSRCLDRLLIPAGQTFSFWKLVGRTTKSKGYVYGRQIQEGCLIPARGGGICQLTNMLYEAALSTGCEIVERHPHTRKVPGARANKPDATVAWNHIDLRFRSTRDLYLRAYLSPDELILQVFGGSQSKRVSLPLVQAQPASANSCATCGQDDCFRSVSVQPSKGKAAALVDRVWPEYADFLLEEQVDVLLLPLDPRRFARPAYQWPTEVSKEVKSATFETLYRSWRSRKLANEGAARRRAAMEADEAVARSYARRLTPDVTRLIVYQQFLPFLQRDGHLGGRHYEVLMTRMPIAELQRVLDQTAQDNPGNPSLSDFRAEQWMVDAELEALANADRIITPHTGVAAWFPSKAVLLPWSMPKPHPVRPGQAIAFPGPAIARRGSEVVREVAQELGLKVVLAGSDLEREGFWSGIEIDRPAARESWLDGCAVVLSPSVAEDQPRRLLEALACGVPVVASPACGLPEHAGLTTVRDGDYMGALRRLVRP